MPGWQQPRAPKPKPDETKAEWHLRRCPVSQDRVREGRDPGTPCNRDIRWHLPQRLYPEYNWYDTKTSCDEAYALEAG